MNKEQIKGTAKVVAGKVQAKAGQVAGSTKQEVKGVVRQVEGKVQHVVGDTKAWIKEVTKPT